MTERIEGLSIGLDLDSVKVESGLQDLNKKLALVNSEMKANLSAFDQGDKSLQRYGTLLEGLNKKMEVQKARVESARKEYEKMVKQHGENSTQADKAATAYNKEVTSLNKLERTIGKVTAEMNKSEPASKKYGEQLTKISEKADKVGNALTATVTPALLGVGAAAVMAASNFSDATAKIQMNMGMTEGEARKLAHVANDVFTDGWGESLDSVTMSLLEVKEQLSNISDEELAAVTKQAIAMEQVLGMDTSETLRGVNSLMKIYGVSAQEAFDYVVKGAQNGLNKTDELGDNLAEYVPLWEQNGYSIQEMFATLQAGLDAGAYNLDKVNDLVKEFGIRVGDGTIKAAVEEMGGSWQEIYATWEASGESNDALFRKMAQNLASIEDPTERQLALTEIWGSLGEDAGLKVVEALGNAAESYADVNGAAQELTDTMEQSQAQRFASLWREILDELVPVGDVLLEMGETALPILEDAVESLTETWNGMTREQQQMVIEFGMGAAAAGPLIKAFAGLAGGAGSFLTHLPKIVEKLVGTGGVTAAMTTVSGQAAATGAASGLLFNPYVWGAAAVVTAVGGLGYLIYQEMTSDQQNHEEAVKSTQGKYEDWFVAVTDGAGEAAEAQLQIQKATEFTGETYAETAQRIKEQNALVQESINNLWNGKEIVGGYDESMQQWIVIEEASAGIIDSLRNLGNVSEEELASIGEGFGNYSTMIGNTMTDVMNAFATGQVITSQYADSTISAMNLTRDEVIAGLETTQSTLIAKLDLEKQYTDMTDEEYAKQRTEIEMHYGMTKSIVESATSNITDTLAAAAYEGRALTAEEVASMIQSYSNLASSTGESMTSIEGAQDLLAENMRAMVTDVGLQAAVQSGIISQETANQIAAMDNEEQKVRALKSALDEYNNTSIPSKTVIVANETALEKIRTIRRELESIPDRNVSVSVAYSSVGASAAMGPRPLPTWATGTNFHPGGLAVLGDGGKQEPYLTPQGVWGISPATDTLFDLPRGTKVWPSVPRMKMELDIPHFATGSTGSTEVQRMLASFSRMKLEEAQASGTMGNATGSGMNTQLLSKIIVLLESLNDKNSDIYMDKTRVGRLLSSVIKETNEAADLREARLRGVRE